MRPWVRLPLIAALLAAALWSPRRSAADDEAPSAPQVSDEQRQRVATHATHIAKALGQSGIEGGIGSGPKAPKVGKRVVATHRSAKQSLDGGGPPPLGDIATAPTGQIGRIKSLLPGTREAQVLSWLSADSTDEEDRAVSEAFDYYRLNTSAGHGASDLLRPTKGQSDGRSNFGDTGPALAVTIPLKGVKGYHDEQWRVTFRNDQHGAPIEAMALLVGHELGVHAADAESDFLNNPGAQMPSELRALVMDARNYLEIREQIAAKDPERLKTLSGNAVWQLGDLKARMVLGLLIDEDNYRNTQIKKEAAEVRQDINSTPDEKNAPRLVVRRYLQRVYGASGETGMANLDRLDDSPVGQYNKETDRLIATMKQQSYESMTHGF